MIGSGVRFKNTRKRGLEGKTGPKRCCFGLFFFFKGTGSKMRAKMTSVWTQKNKNKIRASQP